MYSHVIMIVSRNWQIDINNLLHGMHQAFPRFRFIAPLVNNGTDWEISVCNPEYVSDNDTVKMISFCRGIVAGMLLERGAPMPK